MAALHEPSQDTGFQPEVPLRGGEVFELPGASTLRVIHTPGHAANHLCYLLEQERMLFTGDHVMQGSTVVINPPDGDMRAYLDSLRELMQLDLDWLAPGHGFLMAEPRRAIQHIVETEVEADAIGRFKARADSYARQFGFAGYSLREVSVAAGDSVAVPMQAVRAARMSVAGGADEFQPVEPGKTTVSVTVSGSIQLLPK